MPFARFQDSSSSCRVLLYSTLLPMSLTKVLKAPLRIRVQSRRPLSVQNVNCFLANEFARLSVADFIRRISKESSPLLMLLLLLLLATSTRLRLVTIIRLLCTAKHCTRMCKFIITVLCVCARRQSVHTYMSWPSSSSSSWCM